MGFSPLIEDQAKLRQLDYMDPFRGLVKKYCLAVRSNLIRAFDDYIAGEVLSATINKKKNIR